MTKLLRRLAFASAFFAAAVAAQAPPPAASPTTAPEVTPATGTLVMDIAPFRSEITLKKKIQAQLETGGLEWGQKDKRIVLTMLNKRFVNFDMSQFTRYGSKTELHLPAGDYQVNCVGFVPSAGFDVMKIVAKGAYFNTDVMTVHVDAGKVTTLALAPVIKKQHTFFVDFFAPDLVATSTLDGVTSEPITLNALTSASVKWPEYKGDLKFEAAK